MSDKVEIDYKAIARVMMREDFKEAKLGQALAEVAAENRDAKVEGEGYKYGLLKNGVQMIRYASGPLLTLIGKRDRGPCERQGGKTGKIIYKITISRESHAAEVAIDGVSQMTLCSTSNHLLEHCALSVMNSIILTRARDRKHKINNKKNRKAKAAAAKEVK